MVRWRLRLLIGVCGLALASPALAVNEITVGSVGLGLAADQPTVA